MRPLEKFRKRDVVGISSVAEAIAGEVIEYERLGRIHGNHLHGLVENARSGLEVDQRVVHSVATGIVRNVATEIDGLMDRVSVTNIVPR